MTLALGGGLSTTTSLVPLAQPVQVTAPCADVGQAARLRGDLDRCPVAPSTADPRVRGDGPPLVIARVTWLR